MQKARPLETRLPAALPQPWEMIVQRPECYPPAHEVAAVVCAAQQADDGLMITISVAHIVDRGIEAGYFAFVTYEGSEVKPPLNRIFSVSRRTNPPRRRGTDPKTALTKLKCTARKAARRRGIAYVINLD